MGRPERDGRCNRHPMHKESKGVCPSCLRERLSYLIVASSSASSSVDSSGYIFSSALSSSRFRYPDGKRAGSGSMRKPLDKSRSLAAVIGRDREEEERAKKRSGLTFWSKLITVAGQGKKENDLGMGLHSKTVKEKSSTKWALF